MKASRTVGAAMGVVGVCFVCLIAWGAFASGAESPGPPALAPHSSTFPTFSPAVSNGASPPTTLAPGNTAVTP